MNKPKFYWHIHHDTLVETLTEPIENRIKYIKENKPKSEIALRLKLLRPVKGKLPKEFIEARNEHDEANKRYHEALEKYIEAWNKRDKACKKYIKEMKKYRPLILALHEKECSNCTWNEERQNIFKEGK